MMNIIKTHKLVVECTKQKQQKIFAWPAAISHDWRGGVLVICELESTLIGIMQIVYI